MPLSLDAPMGDLVALAAKAGARIMDHYGRCAAIAKHDGSPLTAADLAADEVIAEGLARIVPGVPVLSEEAVERFDPSGAAGLFILVDPLDGTREFLSGNGEFTVNIALVENGIPVAGVVYAPVRGRAWAGVAGVGAQAMDIAPGQPLSAALNGRAITVAPAHQPLVAAVSRSHCDPQTEAWLKAHAVGQRIDAGSSLKFCLLAEGLADVYPRFSPTMEWDTAAGHAVLAAAGGVVLAPDGGPLRYGKVAEGFRNGAFVGASARGLVLRAA